MPFDDTAADDVAGAVALAAAVAAWLPQPKSLSAMSTTFSAIAKDAVHAGLGVLLTLSTVPSMAPLSKM